MRSRSCNGRSSLSAARASRSSCDSDWIDTPSTERTSPPKSMFCRAPVEPYSTWWMIRVPASSGEATLNRCRGPNTTPPIASPRRPTCWRLGVSCAFTTISRSPRFTRKGRRPVRPRRPSMNSGALVAAPDSPTMPSTRSPMRRPKPSGCSGSRATVSVTVSSASCAKRVVRRGMVAGCFALSSSSTRHACDISTAKFMFCARLSAALEVLMPMTSPVSRLISGPPEFPGLIGASVWIMGYPWAWLVPARMPRVAVNP